MDDEEPPSAMLGGSRCVPFFIGKRSRVKVDVEDFNQTNLMENLDITPMLETNDIIFENLGNDGGFYDLKSFFFHIFIFIILIFLSTPSVVLLTLKRMDYFDLINSPFFDENFYGSHLSSYGPPLFILIINKILFVIIDWTSRWEYQFRHSQYQYSIFKKATFYMMLNQFVIPGLTLNTNISFWFLISKTIKEVQSDSQNAVNSMGNVVGSFFLIDSGFFFVTLLIQKGFFQSGFSLLRLGEVSYNWFSPYLCVMKRMNLNRSKSWRREFFWTFPYGFAYADMVVCYITVLFFSTTVPLITFSGVLLLLLRHLSDFYSLLIVYRKEM